MEVKVDTVRIRQLRRERAMSQDELAGATGLSVRTIQRIESEGIASLESKKALASVFDVAPESLDAESLGDRREERARFLAGLKGGTLLGMAGALIGGASAYVGITSSLVKGTMSAGDAGVAYGVVGALVGLTCGVIGVIYDKLRRRVT